MDESKRQERHITPDLCNITQVYVVNYTQATLLRGRLLNDLWFLNSCIYERLVPSFARVGNIYSGKGGRVLEWRLAKAVLVQSKVDVLQRLACVEMDLYRIFQGASARANALPALITEIASDIVPYLLQSK